jgi:NAD(P)H-flavin reductase/hemoglobin-like flavoprotein
MPECDNRVVAIALDGGFAEASEGEAVAQPRLSAFRRCHEQSEPAAGLAGTNTVNATNPPVRRFTGCAGQIAQVGLVPSPAMAAAEDVAQPASTDFSARLIKESFAHVMAHPQASMEYFYSHLFAQNPEIRSLFPLAMTELRDRVFAALARLVWSMDAPEAYTAFLRQLALAHRKFGIRDKHHRPFFTALLATVRHFAGAEWTSETEAAWTSALQYAEDIMRAAAAADARTRPPWWLGEVVAHDLRTASIAVLTIRPDQPLTYLPGQYVDVQVPRWPRLWRSYSVANAPAPDGLLELHVRAVRGGMVSSALVHRLAVGESILLGRAQGEMTAPPGGRRDLLCVAGGTGLAPIKAIVQAVIETAATAASGRQRRITLLFGARRQADLYDLADLARIQAAYPALAVIPVVSGEPEYGGLTGLLPEVVAAREGLADCEIFVSGPPGMITATERVLAGRVPGEQVHHDPLAALPASS